MLYAYADKDGVCQANLFPTKLRSVLELFKYAYFAWKMCHSGKNLGPHSSIRLQTANCVLILRESGPADCCEAASLGAHFFSQNQGEA